MTDLPPNESQQFPCPKCGADSAFDAGTQALTCAHCGHTEDIGTEGEAAIYEYDLDITGVTGYGITLSADGVAVPRATEPIADLSENASLNTAAEEYAWVCTRQIWGVGTVDLAGGRVHIDGFMQ